jgi:hypothetical protein
LEEEKYSIFKANDGIFAHFFGVLDENEPING